MEKITANSLALKVILLYLPCSLIAYVVKSLLHLRLRAPWIYAPNCYAYLVNYLQFYVNILELEYKKDISGSCCNYWNVLHGAWKDEWISPKYILGFHQTLSYFNNAWLYQ